MKIVNLYTNPRVAFENSHIFVFLMFIRALFNILKTVTKWKQILFISQTAFLIIYGGLAMHKQ
jgi:hypothetical protein